MRNPNGLADGFPDGIFRLLKRTADHGRDEIGEWSIDSLPAEIGRAVRRLRLGTRRPLRENLAGSFRSAFRGSGLDFAEVREYQYGDDVRTIDWNVTGRRGKPHVKRFVEERELTVWLMVDRSSSMYAAAVAAQKQWHEAVALLALAGAQAGHRVGALFFSDGVDCRLAPQRGLSAAGRILAQLKPGPVTSPSTSLVAAIGETRRLLPRRAIIFIISDFCFDLPGEGLAALTRQHDVVAVQIAPTLDEPPAGGLAEFAEAETGRKMRLDFSATKTRQEWRQQLESHVRDTRNALRSAGADVVTLQRPRESWAALTEFCLRRARRRLG